MRIRKKYKDKNTVQVWVSDYDKSIAKKLGMPFNAYVKAYVEQTLKDKR
jgi:hypothetical protein